MLELKFWIFTSPQNDDDMVTHASNQSCISHSICIFFYWCQGNSYECSCCHADIKFFGIRYEAVCKIIFILLFKINSEKDRCKKAANCVLGFFCFHLDSHIFSIPSYGFLGCIIICLYCQLTHDKSFASTLYKWLKLSKSTHDLWCNLNWKALQDGKVFVL